MRELKHLWSDDAKHSRFLWKRIFVRSIYARSKHFNTSSQKLDVDEEMTFLLETLNMKKPFIHSQRCANAFISNSRYACVIFSEKKIFLLSIRAKNKHIIHSLSGQTQRLCSSTHFAGKKDFSFVYNGVKVIRDAAGG